jgi:NAD(P)-dependent dehydrogenase (short-subunit alcohol dehydrogenase family)
MTAGPSLDLFDLTGQVALVTGAGRGLGRAAALGLARAGADVAVAARSGGELDEVAAEIRVLGRTASTHRVDIRSVPAIETMVQAVVAQHGHVDILVNNAGTKVVQPVTEVTESAFDEVLDTNLRGAFFCAQIVGRTMLERGRGKIINMASTLAVRGAGERATYAASKGGLLQLTRAMAIEWAGRGVHVNAIGPTATHTTMNDGLFADADYRQRVVERIPAGRPCTPEDVVGPVIFLASRASDMVHGHLLLVDGGWTAL